MNRTKQLHFLKNNEINFDKWDQCVESSNKNNIYATSWFLERNASNWDALVWGDYQYVFPLVWRKKIGIKYLYQPIYCQQLGIFPQAPFEIQKEFANAIANHYKYVEIQVNPNINIEAFSKFRIKKRINMVLPLMDSFQNIKENYSKHAKRNLTKAQKLNVKVVEGVNPDIFLNYKKTANTNKKNTSDLSILKKLIPFSILNSKGIIWGAYTQKNELCAAVYLLHSNQRIVYLNAFSTDEGRENRAMYMIVNKIIKKYANNILFLDFEGSEIEGVARFYRGFGALEETYYQLQLNNLPFPLRYLKK